MLTLNVHCEPLNNQWSQNASLLWNFLLFSCECLCIVHFGILCGKKTQLFALQVTDGHGFWKWTQDTMLKAVYFDYHYNGNKTTLGEEQYMWDMAQFRVGGVRLRQVRVQPGEKLVL